MFCPFCRQELPEGALFCNRCGRSIHIPQPDLSEEPTGTIYPISMGTDMPTRFNDSGPFRLADTQVRQITSKLAPQTPVSSSALQRSLIRVFQPTLAGNAVFGVVLGGIGAAIAGALGTWLLLTVAHAITPSTIQTLYTTNGEESVDYALGIVALHAPFRDILQLFLVMHGVGLNTQYSSGISTSSFTGFSPLNGLLIVPIVFLTLGGYIAASTDMQNRVQSSLLRGGAIAIPYTLMLLLMSSQVNGTIVPSAGTTDTQIGTLTMDMPTLIIFGLLWGILFGLLGASLNLARGQWRHMVHQYFHTNSHPHIVGTVAGACSASVLGLGLSFLVLCGFLAYTTISVPLLARDVCISGNWQLLTLWGIAQGPLHAVNLFFFLLGAPITIQNPQTLSQCFYSAFPQTTLTLRDQNLHLSLWFYTLLFIPALSLFIGGRVSVATSRVQGTGPSAIQGLLITVPFTMIMIFLTFISTVTATYVFADTSGGNPTPHILSAGVRTIDLLLWALLSGAIFGALGGIYEGSDVKSWGKTFLSSLVSLLELPAKPLYWLLDRLSGQPHFSQRSSTRRLLYGAFFCALLLAIVSILVGWILITYNQTISLQENQHLRDVISVLLVTIPGLLLFGACFAALSRDPVEESRGTSPIVTF